MAIGADMPSETVVSKRMRRQLALLWLRGITAGDSIRQRIDEGIGECTHFIVLLTPKSITKPWVNLEIDAGLVRRLSDQTKLIPLRCGLEPNKLTPLLQTFFSPTVDCPREAYMSELRYHEFFLSASEMADQLGKEGMAPSKK